MEPKIVLGFGFLAELILKVGEKFSAYFGEGIFLLEFLIFLNIVDYITGMMKARYLKIESSRSASKGFYRKFSNWAFIFVVFGFTTTIESMGELFNVNLGFLRILGWAGMAHVVINEVRSILENLVATDKSSYIPKWLISGLIETQKLVDKRATEVINSLGTGINPEKKEVSEEISSKKEVEEKNDKQ